MTYKTNSKDLEMLKKEYKRLDQTKNNFYKRQPVIKLFNPSLDKVNTKDKVNSTMSTTSVMSNKCQVLVILQALSIIAVC